LAGDENRMRCRRGVGWEGACACRTRARAAAKSRAQRPKWC
jgi:hypothetical protein